MSSCSISMPLEPRCVAVTLSTTRASLVELHCPTSSADLGTVASVLPLSPLAVLHTSARASLANTVLEIILGTCQVSWALSLSTPPCLSPTFLQQVQAILNSLLWLCHSHLEGGRVSLLYWYFLIHTGLCLVKLVWFDCVPFWLACSFMENCFPRMC